MEQTNENIEYGREKINPDKLVKVKSNEEKIKSDVLVDSNEEIKAILGDSYLKNYFKTGMLKKSFAILTDRRVYMRGRCYEKKGLFGLKKQNVDKVLDVQDITGTEYKNIHKIWKSVFKWLLIACIGIGCITIPINYIMNFSQFSLENKFARFVVVLIEVAVRLLLIKFALKIRTNYEFLTLSFNGGQLAYDCNIATTNEVREFQRQMRLAKDKKISKQEVLIPNRPINPVSTDKFSKLKELKDLLDSGVITDSEFYSLKKELIGYKE